MDITLHGVTKIETEVKVLSSDYLGSFVQRKIVIYSKGRKIAIDLYTDDNMDNESLEIKEVAG